MQPRQPANLPWKQQNNVPQQNIPEQKLPEQSDPTHSGRSISSPAKVITLEWHTERNAFHESSWSGVRLKRCDVIATTSHHFVYLSLRSRIAAASVFLF
jgi:hypothetical protein